mmetsp:Transcript_20065/g.55855  ORF Transcript_20065/g.55855 Transcript_20065/m.55855 type:complete len:181 (+) Transcript_20065:216-758(+)
MGGSSSSSMHSWMHRGNTLITFFGTVAAILCLATTLTDLRHVYNMPDPQVSVSLAEVKRLAPMTGSKEQATLTFSMDADLRSVFSWNTKQLFLFLQAEYGTPDSTVNQVVLWDTIIQQKEKARIRLKNHKTKYSFIHPSKGLKGAQVNLTLVWHVMPRVGFMYTQSRTFPGGRLPDKYVQ